MDRQIRNALILGGLTFFFTRDIQPTLVVAGASYVLDRFV